MPVHRKKKDTTPTPPSSTQEQTSPPLPDQQTFRQYLRDLARGAIRVVLEEVMREELDALIGVGWGECNPKRKGYRNGFYSRDLVTSSGRLEDLKVPRDREGHFQIPYRMLCSDRTEKKGQPAHSIGLSPARGRDQVRGVGTIAIPFAASGGSLPRRLQ